MVKQEYTRPLQRLKFSINSIQSLIGFKVISPLPNCLPKTKVNIFCRKKTPSKASMSFYMKHPELSSKLPDVSGDRNREN